MKLYLKLLLAGLLVFSLTMGCKKKDKTQSVAPANAGERGTSCQAKNDCGSNLSCILGICQPANFNLNVTGKECHIIDCAETQNCCGNKETEAPPKCRDRDTYCNPEIVGCSTVASSCVDDTQCAGNAVCGGSRWCLFTGTACAGDAQCADVCEFPAGMGGAGAIGTCSRSLVSCTTDSNCIYNGDTCGTGFCTCDNPNFDLSHEICSDPDCDNVCTLVCNNEQRCVEDNACRSDDDCVSGERNLCGNSGECVECKTNEDCDDPLDDTDDEDVCNAMGSCITPCESDAQCPMVSACRAPHCEYVGCRTTQECVLLGVGAGIEDPRLATCHVENGIGTCRISCEMDAHCASSQVCRSGICEYIGCAADSDCKSILSLHNWERNDETPWLPEAICRTPNPAP